MLSGKVPFSEQDNNNTVMKLVFVDNKRPPTSPMFSPSPAEAPYYRTWRAAIHCWLKDPSKRPSIDEVVQMLQPLEVPTPVPGSAALPALPSDSAPVGLTESPAGTEASVAGSEEDDEGPNYCYCKHESIDDMIDCKEAKCDRQWVSNSASIVSSSCT